MRRALIGLAAAAGLVGLLYAVTMGMTGVECEVCVQAEGGSLCRTVAAATRDAAVGTALSNACAVVGRNVTERVACERRDPLSLVCRAH